MDHGISAPGYGREVVDGLNGTSIRFICNLMANVELPGSKRFYTQMELQTATQNTDESLAQELQNTFQTNHTNMVFYIMENTKR